MASKKGYTTLYLKNESLAKLIQMKSIEDRKSYIDTIEEIIKEYFSKTNKNIEVTK